ncbi:MAG: Crp/Fnr family transcriptional regulator [Candidatus Omnitrophica bacterium]|nr:Crp/Fnr family transcriptional regulator [Candidatus Omnitrophota bacterium]
MDTKEIWYLERVDSLRVLTPDELSFLMQGAVRKIFNKGEIIFMPGDKGDTVFLITGGRVKLYNLSPSGKESILFIFFPGELIGLSEIFGKNIRVSFAEAIERITLLIIHSSKFIQMLDKNSLFTRSIAETLGKRLMAMGKRFESVSSENLTCRIVQLLISLSDMYGAERNREILLAKKIIHQDIANMVGAARQSVTEVLNSLIRKGAIRYDSRKRIIITDKAKMMNIIYSCDVRA